MILYVSSTLTISLTNAEFFFSFGASFSLCHTVPAHHRWVIEGLSRLCLADDSLRHNNSHPRPLRVRFCLKVRLLIPWVITDHNGKHNGVKHCLHSPRQRERGGGGTFVLVWWLEEKLPLWVFHVCRCREKICRSENWPFCVILCSEQRVCSNSLNTVSTAGPSNSDFTLQVWRRVSQGAVRATLIV